MSADLSGVCVLVVEDEPIVALDLATMLEEAGADVMGPALTMEAADRLSDNTRITVAVLDVRLGNGTVHAVASKLSRRGVPIIFHTGHGAVEMVSAQWPGSRILAKPARSDELLAAILAAFKAPAL